MNIFIKPQKPTSGVDLYTRRMLATEILSSLEDLGFSRCKRLETKFGDNSEIVYAKPLSKKSRYMVAVYTSCNQVGGAFVARSSGKDAIRVAGLYVCKDGSVTGVIKNKRVNRVGKSEDICKRMMGRIRSSLSELRQDNIEKCTDCGAPKFGSKKGNLVCSEMCWRK